jgi:uncharacterized protein
MVSTRRRPGCRRVDDGGRLANRLRARLDGPVNSGFDEAVILKIERPHASLWTYYLLVSLGALPVPPLFVVLLLVHWFRYHTMRYHFTEEGVSMSWGILFRRQVILNYTRIQDIHLQSNIVERWLGLGRLLIQTASGSSGAEMTLEGLKEFEQVRDFLYFKMRGVHDATLGHPSGSGAPPVQAVQSAGAGLEEVLRETALEIRRARESMERLLQKNGGPGGV